VADTISTSAPGEHALTKAMALSRRFAAAREVKMMPAVTDGC
jgi:hypothetical protein